MEDEDRGILVGSLLPKVSRFSHREVEGEVSCVMKDKIKIVSLRRTVKGQTHEQINKLRGGPT